MTGFIGLHFLPVRINLNEQVEVFRRFEVQWTPRILLLDSAGVLRHQVDGYLPAYDFVAQLHLGYAHAAFSRGLWAEAERGYREVVEKFPEADAAPEALHWSGVAAYKLTGNVAVLPVTASKLRQRYPGSSWTKKASVWLA